ncbi:Hypothetical protein EUBREC_0491 [Agathobacter rectalis ATCC 33656]|uniref:Uncharacterized protein n=1 Tax=Agathobacter rectalis (strain ATCC 33656 / DSM 3377 / JCM 17463 / KCTC 5835 / VPI 0990) TaxID=515619 RepID=C4ZBZ2_AGARV|nr:Hypothetical protein EUBREC_0491 [Agathobacter rectalis ATCC 33656]
MHSSKRATAVAGRSKRSGWLIEDNKEREVHDVKCHGPLFL